MAKPKPLSNRQRKAQRKVAPKGGRRDRPSAHVMAGPPEPRGVAAREAVRDDLARRERMRVLSAVACGELDEADALDGLGYDVVAGAEMVSVDRRGDRQAGIGLRVRSRDGLAALHKSGALTDDQVKAGLAFRLCFELAEQALGSCLGRVGEGRGARDWSQLSIAVTPEGEFELMQSAADLHRTFVMTKLNQMERAVFGLPDPDGRVWLARPDGRELQALREIAGAGRTVNEVAGTSGHAREMTKAALSRSLNALAGLLRITGN